MDKSINDKLKELKKFRNNINPETSSKLEQLLETIKTELPEPYNSKLNVLKIYEYKEVDESENDLPF